MIIIFPVLPLLLLIFATLLLICHSTSLNDLKTYIVYTGNSVTDEASSLSLYKNMLQQVSDSNDVPKTVLHHYKRSFSGFVAKLTEEEADKMAGLDGVVSVFPNEKNQLHTTKSWDFVGFTQQVQKSITESNVIIGVIDTGIWPESKSFNDKGFSPPPSKWKGTCQASNFTCNNKIIGAKYYKAAGDVSFSEEDIKSPRDSEGHGTHTASTAAGNPVSMASMFGFGQGTARGGATSARIAVYKVCWSDGCDDADILAAFDDAIADGVDILSVSLGKSSDRNYFRDGLSIGSFHAMRNGILTVFSAGNSGPRPASVENLSPWAISVAASTIDRKFVTKVELGNNGTYEGVSINTFDLKGELYPIIYGGDAPNTKVGADGSVSRFCYAGTLDPKLVKGKIVLCEGSRTQGLGPWFAGAVGFLTQGQTSRDNIFSFPLPGSYLELKDGANVYDYIHSTRTPTATIFKSDELNDTLAPLVASFSSRGPNIVTPEILKPDLIAPGVDIIASWSPISPVSGFFDDKRISKFNIISGTSMACPHVSGAAGYIKSLHPTWSPAAIRSALMTTAKKLSPLTDRDAEFGYGAGQIDPAKAANPGLVYDADENDYVRFLCGQGYSSRTLRLITGDKSSCSKTNYGTARDLNYPSFALQVPRSEPNVSGIFNRTVTNVGLPRSTYKAIVTAPPGLIIKVNPSVLSFTSLGQKQAFVLTVHGTIAQPIVSASLVWDDGKFQVRSPIIVFWKHQAGNIGNFGGRIIRDLKFNPRQGFWKHQAAFFCYVITSLTMVPIFSALPLLLLTFTTVLLICHSTSLNDLKTYIVYSGNSVTDEASSLSLYKNMLQQVSDSSDVPKTVMHHYKRSFSGFVAKLTEEEADRMAELDGVVSVFPNEKKQLHTTKSWDFIGFTQQVQKSITESNVIIGVIDSGIWPESDSFNDKGFSPPPPSKWKGTCQSSNFTCNNKIIGAKYYRAAGDESFSKEDIKSPRDSDGHGTHTASTAAGNPVSMASMFGFGQGTARGGATSARIAVYKVCWYDGCYDADILAAFDDAIADGVDILSVSLGSDSDDNYFRDVMSIGSFHAMRNGILTVFSAGNSGPTPASVENFSPWSISVAASTINRKFVTKVELGNNGTYEGVSINTFDLKGELYPIIYGGDAPNTKAGADESVSRFCYAGTLDPKLVKGKIVLCEGRRTQGLGPWSAGAVGFLTQGQTSRDNIFSFPLPGSYLDLKDGANIYDYIRSTRTPTATIFKSDELNDTLAPLVASFSSRGPNIVTPEVLKPDLIAPGVDIIASWSPISSISGFFNDKRISKFNIISGTSMACPHVSGAAGYIKSLHPTWSPAAIRSALMTTAKKLSPLTDRDAEFGYGAGQIDPAKAANPGLVYDADENDYVRFLCGQGYSSRTLRLITGDKSSCSKTNYGTARDLNYPSFALQVPRSEPNVGGSFNRTVTNVGLPRSTYKAIVTAPPGLRIQVNPSVLSFTSLGQKQTFVLTVDGTIAQPIVSASLVWDDGKFQVRSPIIVFIAT
ncbi:hypothetical protein RIF29_17469 [Crotalaria pallida]|uniref:Cucumisin n=1 Tax=Crotalaria pallida TaxID=3830 RepID=A0AAN9FMZ9_CROPI